jgi:SagB-type dehydrogenase family enzyme
MRQHDEATATQTLHRLTSYSPGQEWTVPAEDPRVVQDLEVNDLTRFPWFFKRYAQPLPRIALPRDLPATTAPTIAILAGTGGVARTELDLPQLARLLHLCAGVVRTWEPRRVSGVRVERGFTTWQFRAAGSAGGRFPMEVYVAVPERSELPAGVHWFDASEHALVQVGPAPQGDAPAIVVTGVPWRTGWRYRERGYRHIYWDAGTMLAQLLAAAESAGIPASLHSRFPDTAVASLVGADGVHEWPVAVVTLDDGAPALEATGPAAAGEVDAAPLEFPLETWAQHAGDLDVIGPAADPGEPVDVRSPGGDSVENVVLARGSQRSFDSTRGLVGSLLHTSMRVALRGIELPVFVAVHDVEGVAPGLYRCATSWPALPWNSRSPEMRPSSSSRRPRSGAWTTADTAKPSSPPVWSTVGSTSPRTPWAAAHAG